jgi:hypothetical protein
VAEPEPFLPSTTQRVTYRAYGLTLTTLSALPAIRPFSPPGLSSDLQIDIGSRNHWVDLALAQPTRIVPTSRSHSGETDSHFALKVHGSGHFFQLSYADGTRFIVDSDATRVWGEAGPGLCDDDLFVYLLGPVMGFVLRKRACLALHASVVELGDFALALSGSASAGKSTTAAAFALRGFPILTEDVTPIKECSSTFLVEPGYPRICLWPDSVKQLLGSADALPLLTPNWHKRYLPLDGVRARFEAEPKTLGAIYLLSPRTTDSDAPRIEDIPPREALLNLVQNTYMNYLLNRDQRAAEFDVLTRLIARVPVRRIIPHADPARLPTLCNLIVKDAAALSASASATTSLIQSA